MEKYVCYCYFLCRRLNLLGVKLQNTQDGTGIMNYRNLFKRRGNIYAIERGAIITPLFAKAREYLSNDECMQRHEG